MNLLLDTHAAIWALTQTHRVPQSIRELISAPGNAIFVSAVCIWEIAIKRPLGRMSAPSISAEEAILGFAEAGYAMLPVTPRHAAAVESLPLLHGDPFDRLLVAQALSEPLRLVTHDRALAAYSDTVIAW